MTEPAVSFRNVTKKYRVYREKNQTVKHRVLRRRASTHDDFFALQDVSFDVMQGSSFGIIGSNGAGKSTLLKLAAGILAPDEGTITTRGRIGALLELGAGFHGELSGRENVYLNGALLGMRRIEVRNRIEEIVEFSGVGDHLDNPVKTYSSGMVARLGFAIAIHIDPDILILDEVLAVGDAMFQARCRAKVDEFRRSGRTVLVVSHSLPDIHRMCGSAAWIDHGHLRSQGLCDDVLGAYLASEVVDGASMEWRGVDVDLRFIDPDDQTHVSTASADTVAQSRQVLISGQSYKLVVSVTTDPNQALHVLRLVFRTSDGTVVASLDCPSVEDAKAGSGTRQLQWTFHLESLPFLGGPLIIAPYGIGENGRATEISGASSTVTVDHPYDSGRDHGLVQLRGGWDA